MASSTSSSSSRTLSSTGRASGQSKPTCAARFCSLAARDNLMAEVEAQKAHVVRLSGVAAQAINRMETALRGTATDDLDTLEPTALLTKYQNVRDKFEKTFPTGRKAASVVDTQVQGEQRPRQDAVAEAAQQATKI